MNVLVIGANGQIGQKITHKISSNTSHAAVAMVRKAEQMKPFEAKNIETRLGDLEGDFSSAYEGCNAVIFTAGSGGHTGKDKTKLVDQDGAIKAMDLAMKHGVERFIIVSALGTNRDPDQWPESMSHYYLAKRAADEHLVQSKLNYTVLRPGRLSDEEPTGKVEAAEQIESGLGRSIARADVAEVAVKSLDQPATHRKAIDLLEGDTPIEQALEQL